MMLKPGTSHCPDDGERLHFEIIGMMRVRRPSEADPKKFIYRTRCPKCGNHFDVEAPGEG